IRELVGDQNARHHQQPRVAYLPHVLGELCDPTTHIVGEREQMLLLPVVARHVVHAAVHRDLDLGHLSAPGSIGDALWRRRVWHARSGSFPATPDNRLELRSAPRRPDYRRCRRLHGDAGPRFPAGSPPAQADRSRLPMMPFGMPRSPSFDDALRKPRNCADHKQKRGPEDMRPASGASTPLPRRQSATRPDIAVDAAVCGGHVAPNLKPGGRTSLTAPSTGRPSGRRFRSYAVAVRYQTMELTVTHHNDLANAIRALSMDAVEQAQSGHPGMPMGMADVATVLFTRF